MGTHKKIKREDLKQDVLDAIGESHCLGHCPVCGEKTEKPSCFDEIENLQYGAPGSGSLKSICNKCEIVWQLDLLNWSNRRGQAVNSSDGHHISLKAFAKCFCRVSLIDVSIDPIRVHEAGGHARFYYRCGSTKVLRETVIMRSPV